MNNGFDEKRFLTMFPLTIHKHDFITILVEMGGKIYSVQRHLRNIAIDEWQSIYILGENVTSYSPEKRAKYLSRVFKIQKWEQLLVWHGRRIC